ARSGRRRFESISLRGLLRLAAVDLRPYLLPDRFSQPRHRAVRVGVVLLDVRARCALDHGSLRTASSERHPRRSAIHSSKHAARLMPIRYTAAASALRLEVARRKRRMMCRRRACARLGPILTIALVCCVTPRSARAASHGIEAVLDSVRTAAGIPALGAVVVDSDSSIALAVVGVRRKGHPERVTAQDLFHIG